MRTRPRTNRLTLVALLALAPACDAAETPTTAIWVAGASPPAINPETQLGCAIDEIEDHQGVTIRHQLPDTVEVEVPLTITVLTPCVESTTTARHDLSGRAETTVVAPAGAACGLTVTVEIADDRQVCGHNATNPKACMGLDEICAPVDADPDA